MERMIYKKGIKCEAISFEKLKRFMKVYFEHDCGEEDFVEASVQVKKEKGVFVIKAEKTMLGKEIEPQKIEIDLKIEE